MSMSGMPLVCIDTGLQCVSLRILWCDTQAVAYLRAGRSLVQLSQ